MKALILNSGLGHRMGVITMELENPVAEDRQKEIEILSSSVNPVRLKNNPVELNKSFKFPTLRAKACKDHRQGCNPCKQEDITPTPKG